MRKIVFLLLLLGITVQAQFAPLIGIIGQDAGTGVVELWPQDNAAAASDNNSVGSILDERGATVTVDATTSYDGSYSIKNVCSTTTFAGAYVVLTGLEIGATYTVTAWCKADVVDEQQMLLDDAGGWVADDTAAITGTTFAQYSVTAEAAATTANVFFQSNQTPAIAGRTIWFDLVSITKN